PLPASTLFPYTTLFRSIRFFKPLLTRVLPRVSNAAGAMLKTTIAFTMAGGSQGRNVLPQEAWVVGNMRFSIHQGQQSSFEAIRKDRKSTRLNSSHVKIS